VNIVVHTKEQRHGLEQPPSVWYTYTLRENRPITREHRTYPPLRRTDYCKAILKPSFSRVGPQESNTIGTPDFSRGGPQKSNTILRPDFSRGDPQKSNTILKPDFPRGDPQKSNTIGTPDFSRGDPQKSNTILKPDFSSTNRFERNSPTD
jgi:hypothetical protein